MIKNNLILSYLILLIVLIFLGFLFVYAQATPNKPSYVCNTIVCRVKNMGGVSFPSVRPETADNSKNETEIPKTDTGVSDKSALSASGPDEGFERLGATIKTKWECDENDKNCKPIPHITVRGKDLLKKVPSDIIFDEYIPTESGWSKFVQKGDIKPAEKNIILHNKVKKTPSGFVGVPGDSKMIKIDKGVDGIATNFIKVD